MSTYESTLGSSTVDDDGGAKERAAAVAGEAKEHVAEVAGSAKEHGLDVVDEAKSQARDLLGETRGRLREQADEQAHTVAAQLSEAADDLLSMSRSAEHPDHAVVEATRQLGEKARQVSDHLRSGGFGALVSDAKRFARRRPLAFIGTSLAAGLLVGRVLRNADTSALTEAAKPDGQGGEPAGTQSMGRAAPDPVSVPQATISAPTVGTAAP